MNDWIPVLKSALKPVNPGSESTTTDEGCTLDWRGGASGLASASAGFGSLAGRQSVLIPVNNESVARPGDGHTMGQKAVEMAMRIRLPGAKLWAMSFN